MARIFKVEVIKLRNTYIVSGDFDPSSVGYAAPTGSLFVGEGGSLYTKTSSADIGWSVVAGGAGGGQPLDATLTALAGLNSTAGLLEQTGTDSFTKRAIGVAASTSIPTRADADARYAAIDATLTSLAALNATAGLLEQTAADTFTKRAIGVAASTSIPTRADADSRYALSGSDFWTYVKLSSEATNDLTTPINTNLRFTPGLGKQYEIWGVLFMRSVASTTGVRVGVTFPSGMSVSSDGGGVLIDGPGGTTTATNTQRARVGGTNLTLASTAHPGGTGYYVGTIWGSIITSATASGDFIVTLESEISASQVRLGIGSFIRYREVP